MLQFCQACGSPRPADAIPSRPVHTEITATREAAKTEQSSKIEDENELLTFADEDIIFYQLRSRATKALCKLITHPGECT